jgi:hypothetical protein
VSSDVVRPANPVSTVNTAQISAPNAAMRVRFQRSAR